MYGLDYEQVQFLRELFITMHEIEKAVICGARPEDNYSQSSDIKIALFGRDITPSIIARIKYLIEEESLIPLLFEIEHIEKIMLKELQERIIKEGKILYQR